MLAGAAALRWHAALPHAALPHPLRPPKESQGTVNAIDFHRTLDLLVTSSEDDRLQARPCIVVLVHAAAKNLGKSPCLGFRQRDSARAAPSNTAAAADDDDDNDDDAAASAACLGTEAGVRHCRGQAAAAGAKPQVWRAECRMDTQPRARAVCLKQGKSLVLQCSCLHDAALSTAAVLLQRRSASVCSVASLPPSTFLSSPLLPPVRGGP
jgi:hypothetical protein